MSISIEFDTTLCDGLPVHVMGEYSFGHPGQTSGPPEACFPSEPSEFEFEVFWREKKHDKKLYACKRELTDKDEEKIYLEADKYMEDWYDDYD